MPAHSPHFGLTDPDVWLRFSTFVARPGQGEACLAVSAQNHWSKLSQDMTQALTGCSKGTLPKFPDALMIALI